MKDKNIQNSETPYEVAECDCEDCLQGRPCRPNSTYVYKTY